MTSPEAAPVATACSHLTALFLLLGEAIPVAVLRGLRAADEAADETAE